MKIALINEGKSDNLGDQLINFTIKQLIKSYSDKVSITNFSYSAITDFKRNHNSSGPAKKSSGLKRMIGKSTLYKLYARKRWISANKNFFKGISVEKFDLVIVGGGQLLNNSWLYPFLFQTWIRQFRNQRIVIYAIGMGSGFSKMDFNMIRKTLQFCDLIIVRDEYSRKMITEQMKKNAVLSKDPVFAISDYISIPDKFERVVVLPASYENVYLQHNAFIPEEEYFYKWVKIINDYKSKGKEVWVSITDLHQDQKIFHQLKKHFASEKLITFTIPNDAEDLVHIIGSSRTVCSARMHALIIGYSYGCNCDVFPISLKLKTFENEILKGSNLGIVGIKQEIQNSIKQIFSS